MIALAFGSTILFAFGLAFGPLDAMAKSISAASLKIKNPNAPAVKREAEEDWGR